MNTHISKELAQWLKERGCKIPFESSYVKNTLIHGEVSMFLMAKAVPAYSWYDILVTKRVEFFGKTRVTMPDETHVILHYLQCGMIEAAEKEFKEECVFAKQEIK